MSCDGSSATPRILELSEVVTQGSGRRASQRYNPVLGNLGATRHPAGLPYLLWPDLISRGCSPQGCLAEEASVTVWWVLMVDEPGNYLWRPESFW